MTDNELESLKRWADLLDNALQAVSTRGDTSPGTLRNIDVCINGIRAVLPEIPKRQEALRDRGELIVLLRGIREVARERITKEEQRLAALQPQPKPEQAKPMPPPEESTPTPTSADAPHHKSSKLRMLKEVFRPTMSHSYASLAGAVFALMGVISGVIVERRKPSVAPEYTHQLASLDKTKDSIQSLLGFIDDQKKQLQLSQQAVDALKSEENKIHPLVEADRRVVDALFAVQEQRNQAAQSRERYIGFGLGVVASLLASIVISMIGRFRRKAGS